MGRPVSESVTAGTILEAQVVDEAGHVVEVTIARPGQSMNGYIYSEEVLREAVPLWNGAPAFLDHPTALDLTRAGGRSLRDLVGVYEGARYEPGRGIRASLRLNAQDHGAFETIREAISAAAAGRMSAPVGISADWRLLKAAAPAGANGRARWLVHKISAVNSGDLVIRPSAGGSFDRILEAEEMEIDSGRGLERGPAGRPQGTGALKRPEGDWRVTESGAGLVVSSEAEGANRGSTVVQPSGSGGPGGAKAALGVVLESGGENGRGEVVDAGFRALVERQVADAVAPLRLQLAQAQVESRIGASGLPAPAQALLRGQLSHRVYEAGEIDQAIGTMRSMLGEVFGQSAIRGAGSVLDAGYRQGTTPLDKIQAAFDRLFGLEVPAELSGVPRLLGIREAYVLITGDKFFTGQYHWEDSVVREANEVTNSVLANVVLNSMTKRLVRDYQAQAQWSTGILGTEDV